MGHLFCGIACMLQLDKTTFKIRHVLHQSACVCFNILLGAQHLKLQSTCARTSEQHNKSNHNGWKPKRCQLIESPGPCRFMCSPVASLSTADVMAWDSNSWRHRTRQHLFLQNMNILDPIRIMGIDDANNSNEKALQLVVSGADFTACHPWDNTRTSQGHCKMQSIQPSGATVLSSSEVTSQTLLDGTMPPGASFDGHVMAT